MKKKIILVSLLWLIFPAMLLAQGNDQTGARGKQEGQSSAVCQRVIDKLSKAAQIMNTREEALRNRHSNINAGINNRRTARLEQVENIRQKWDENRIENFQKLRERAETEEEKQAVEVFAAKIEEALRVKRDAFDRLAEEFQAELDNLVSARQNMVRQRTEGYKAAVAQAYENGKNSCEAGESLAQVQQTLRAALKQAKEGYKNGINSAGSYANEIQSLTKEKRDGIKEATDLFHETVQQAMDDLKSAFDQD